MANGFFRLFNDAGEMRSFRRVESTGRRKCIFSFDVTVDNQVIALASAPFLRGLRQRFVRPGALVQSPDDARSGQSDPCPGRQQLCGDRVCSR